MLERSDFSNSEFSFLVSQKILPSQVYDARGRGPTTFKDEAKALGFLFGMANPCSKGGHRLFTRSGHCIQCDTSKISYIRRFGDTGYVYIAASKKGRLLKVGSTSDVESRSSTLNSEGGYAGADDWVIIAYAKTPGMGRVEFEIHKNVEDMMSAKEYEKAGQKQTAREVLRGDLKRVWKTYQAAISKTPEKERWRHPKLAMYDFGT